MPDLYVAFGVIATVLMVTALASGLVERSPLSFPLIFLGLGLALGEGGIGVVEIGLDDDILEIVATLTLSLVLFLDAVQLQIDELGRRWVVPALVLGPGHGDDHCHRRRAAVTIARARLEACVYRRRCAGLD